MSGELTPSGILRQYHQAGTIPESMLPLKNVQDTPEDPTKSLRGAFTSILLARVATNVLDHFSQELKKEKDSESYDWHMVPIAEIEEESIDTRIVLLQRKRAYLMTQYRISLSQVLKDELDSIAKHNLPTSVAFSYEKIVEIDRSEKHADDIAEAAQVLDKTTETLLRIAGYDYPNVLKYDPTTKQMIDLVANSYLSYVHPQTNVHVEIEMELNGEKGILGEKYIIDLSSNLHKVALLDPSQYHRIEKQMRKAGKIQDQNIHCPFAMRAQFTAPFLDNPNNSLESNPLQHTFETLIREYIGS